MIAKKDIIINGSYLGHFYKCSPFIIPKGSQIKLKHIYKDNKDPFTLKVYDFEVWEFNGNEIPTEHYITKENFITLQEYREEILNQILN